MEHKTFFAQDLAGNVMGGAHVTVRHAGTETLAAIYDAGGQVRPNPFQAEMNGEVALSAPDGKYDIFVLEDGGVTSHELKQVLFSDVADFADQNAVTADTGRTYANGRAFPGELWDAREFTYQVADQAAEDYHLMTAAQVKLYAEPVASEIWLHALIHFMDPVDDDGWPLNWGPILQRAYDASVRAGRCFVAVPPAPRGKRYVITTPLDVAASHGLKLRGNENCFSRGTEWFKDLDFHNTILHWQPVNPETWFVNVHRDDGQEGGFIGPFLVHNIAFLLDGNGFRFGSEDANLDGIPDDFDVSITQDYVYNVDFSGVYLRGIETIDRYHAADGSLTKHFQVLLQINKGFHCALRDVGLEGGGEQIQFYGGDRLGIERVRGGRCQVGIRFTGSASFAVNHVINDYQIEHWALAAIISDGVSSSIVSPRLEGQGQGFDGALMLPETAQVTEGGTVLTMSGAVDTKLFARTSVIRVDHSATGEWFYAFVEDVLGSQVTLRTNEYFEVPFSDTAAKVTRYCPGIIHSGGGGDSGCSVVGGTINVTDDNPPLVYVASRGEMSVHGVTRVRGLEGIGPGSIVVGNQHGVNGYLNARMHFAGCSPQITANPNHPLVTTDDVRKARNANALYSTSMRTPYGGVAEAEAEALRRIWVMTPKNCATSSNNGGQIVLSEVELDAVTKEKVWAWKKTSADTLVLRDETFSSDASNRLRVRTLVRTISGAAETCRYYFTDDGGSPATTLQVDGDWQWIERIHAFPSQWTAMGNAVRSITFDTGAVYVAAMSVEVLQSNFTLYAPGTWEAPLYMGTRLVWFDGSGNMRAKAGAPSSDTDGVVISAAAVV